jgi:hypothetical protein
LLERLQQLLDLAFGKDFWPPPGKRLDPETAAAPI